MIIIIIYSFNVKLTSATFNNASTRYIINPKTCKRKHLIVCPKAKNNFNETYCMTMTIMIIITVNIVNTVNNTKKMQNKNTKCRNSGARGQEIDGFSMANVKWSIE